MCCGESSGKITDLLPTILCAKPPSAPHHPEFPSTPRLALPVTFLFEDPHTPQPLLHSPNHLSLGMHPATLSTPQDAPTSRKLTQLSSKIRTFLESWPVDTTRVPLFSLHPQHPSLPIRLFEPVGSGRTSDAWRAEVKSVDSPEDDQWTICGIRDSRISVL